MAFITLHRFKKTLRDSHEYTNDIFCLYSCIRGLTHHLKLITKYQQTNNKAE